MQDTVSITISTVEKQYTLEDFQNDVLFFNTACGWKAPTTPEEYVQQLRSQAKIVQEESDELLRAMITQDHVETLDGFIDVLYTFEHFNTILKSGAEQGFDSAFPYEIGVWMESLSYVDKAELMFYPSIIIAAAERVAVNNVSKFTNSKEQAERWKLAMPEYTLSEVDVYGITYYCLRDANGKVKKHCDYVPVDLTDLALENLKLIAAEYAGEMNDRS